MEYYEEKVQNGKNAQNVIGGVKSKWSYFDKNDNIINSLLKVLRLPHGIDNGESLGLKLDKDNIDLNVSANSKDKPQHSGGHHGKESDNEENRDTSQKCLSVRGQGICRNKEEKIKHILIFDLLSNFVQVYKECIHLRENWEDARLHLLIDALMNKKERMSYDFASIELDVKATN